MSGTAERKLDRKATKLARQQQAASVRSLDQLFRVPDFLGRWKGLPLTSTLRGFVLAGPPVRTNPKCPRRRDDVAYFRHKRRKAVKASRRANRA